MRKLNLTISLAMTVLFFATFRLPVVNANRLGKAVMSGHVTVRNPVTAGEGTTKKYDPAGNLKSVTKPEGNVRTMEYDRINRLISVTDDPPDIPDGGGDRKKGPGLNLKTRFEYDGNGNLRHQYDPRDLHTEFVYDELNRREYHIQPNSLSTNYKYDEEGNLKSVTDPNKNTVTYDYDELNRKTDAYYPEDPDSPFISTVSIHTDYDGNNNVTMITEIKKGQDGSD
ncbi:MAG: RHS repeat protein, partial [Gammaproteobacteria bacterium]|nr:RHS repeat protein [Gammaproteobacteria bacterium]